METNSNSISVCDYIKQAKTKTEVDSDVIVPDTKPDICTVLCVTAVVNASEQHCKKDKILFGGSVSFNILYCGEDDPSKIHSMDCTVPFNHQADMPGIDEDSVYTCIAGVQKADYDIKNSRKLSVGALITFHVIAQRTSQKEILNASPDSSRYPSRDKSLVQDYIVACKNIDFDVCETLSVPCKSENTTILSFDPGLDMGEIKGVNGKAVLKGRINLKVLYETDGEISEHTTQFSFTEVADIENLNPSQRIVSRFEVCSAQYESDFSDSGMTVEASVKIRGYIMVCENQKFNAVTDIYSPDYSYEKVSDQILLTSLSDTKQGQDTLKDSVEIPSSESSVTKIHHMKCCVNECNNSIKGDTLTVFGSIKSTIIYSGETDSLKTISKITPYEFHFPYSGTEEGTHIISDVNCVNSGYIMGSGNDIQIRAVLSAEAVVLCTKKAELVTGFNADLKSPTQKNNQPSIVAFFPDSSSDIWQIAKKYNTTCEEIAGINSIDLSKPLEGGKPIIIPKRQI